MLDFGARSNSDFKSFIVKNGAVNSAMLIKAEELFLNDVKGE